MLSIIQKRFGTLSFSVCCPHAILNKAAAFQVADISDIMDEWAGEDQTYNNIDLYCVIEGVNFQMS